MAEPICQARLRSGAGCTLPATHKGLCLTETGVSFSLALRALPVGAKRPHANTVMEGPSSNLESSGAGFPEGK